MPRRVVVLHFNPTNLDKRLARLSDFAVETVMPKGPADLKPLRERPPDAFVVDLDRRPSEGRSVAIQLRRYASTRPVPLVFAGGEDDQVAHVLNLLPHATYVSWQGVAGGVKRAKPIEKPVVPSTMDAYSQTELEPKLGVRDGTTLLLLGAPDGFGKGAAAHRARRGRPCAARHALLAERRRPRARLRAREGRDRPGRDALDLMAEKGLRHSVRPRPARRAPLRDGPGPRRLQGRRDRRYVVGAALQPQEVPLGPVKCLAPDVSRRGARRARRKARRLSGTQPPRRPPARRRARRSPN